MSWTNQIDRHPACEELYRIVRESSDRRVAIDWLKEGPNQGTPLTHPAMASVARYRQSLPDFLDRHGIHMSALVEFRTEIYADAAHQIHVKVLVVDDRGKRHEYRVIV